MLISYMTQMMVMFSVIILVGLFLTWINDGLEHFARRLRYSPPGTKTTAASLQSRSLTSTSAQTTKVRTISVPQSVRVSPSAPLEPIYHDFASKIVKIDLAPRSRVTQDESGEKLGEHVTVLPKAA